MVTDWVDWFVISIMFFFCKLHLYSPG